MATKKKAAKKLPARKAAKKQYSSAASKQVATELHKMHQGKLKSGSGQRVTNPKQAIAIALSEARKKDPRVPPNPNE